MTRHLDTGTSDHGNAESEGDRPAPAKRTGSRLLEQVHDRDIAHALARRLTGYALPDVELRTLRHGVVPLRAHVGGWTTVEFFPGQGPREASDREQELALMRASTDHTEGFRELTEAKARAISVISDPPAGIDLTSVFIDPRGLVLCDPDLVIAGELGLPSVEIAGVKRYRRLTLLTRDARIEKVIFPPEENVDNHLRRIVTWIRAAGA